jgi:hypothetical protein
MADQLDKDLADFFEKSAYVDCLKYLGNSRVHDECLIHHRALYESSGKLATSLVKFFFASQGGPTRDE